MGDYMAWDDETTYKYDEAAFEKAQTAYAEEQERLLAKQYPLIWGFEEYSTEHVYASTLDEYLMFLVKGYINVGLRSGLDAHLMDLLEDEWFYQWPLIHWIYASNLLRGIGCEKNILIAVDILLPMARHGCPGALYDIGCCYMNGWGLEASYAKAIYCWLKAWEMKYHPAKENLKSEYWNGRFVEHEEVPTNVKYAFICEILHWFMTETNLTVQNVDERLNSKEKTAFRKLANLVKRLEMELQKEAPLRAAANMFCDDENNPYKINI